MWEPMTPALTPEYSSDVQDSEASESPEYTSGDFEEDDSDDDSFLNMRRPSVHRPEARPPLLRKSSNQLGDTEPAPSPLGAAFKDQFQQQFHRGAAFKDQFQQQFHQFQQSVAVHFQGFPQLPNIPQMPLLANLNLRPDYQAYLQEHPFMQRVQQFMPSMTGQRPGSEDGDQTKMDHRWWDFLSYMNNSATPPPAYSEIYPNQHDMDVKTTSAAQAATEAEADMKCAALYDQTTEVVDASGSQSAEKSSVRARSPLPSVLKIGRKNAITEEQREHFLRAHEQNLKSFSNDMNLFFVWIPLLLVMICATLYHFFPSFFNFVIPIIRTGLRLGKVVITQLEQNLPDGWRTAVS
jgi:hypothetical protein